MRVTSGKRLGFHICNEVKAIDGSFENVSGKTAGLNKRHADGEVIRGVGAHLVDTGRQRFAVRDPRGVDLDATAFGGDTSGDERDGEIGDAMDAPTFGNRLVNGRAGGSETINRRCGWSASSGDGSFVNRVNTLRGRVDVAEHVERD